MTTALKTRKLHTPTVRMASGLRVMNYSLTDPAVADVAAAFRLRLEQSPELRIKLLKKAGILNRSGKTSKNFGG